jgi:hypothetical protein
VSYFRELAAYRGWAMEEGDPKDGNAAFDTIAEIWAELSRRNAGDDLRPLLNDNDPGVRLAAAGKLLATLSDEAVRVLRELSAHKTVIGLSAAATLEARRLYGG